MAKIRSNSRTTYAVLVLLAAVTVTFVAGALTRTSDDPTASQSAVSRPAGLDDARRALTAENATISVIGDSTGNDSNEWVAFWAQDLGQDHRVTLHQWLDGAYRPDPLSYGDTGARITIWNAGFPGGEADWAVDRMAIVQPERPDLTLLNLGLNNTSQTIAGQLNALQDKLDPGAPAVLILQSPARGALEAQHAAVRRTASRWAAKEGVPTIDVAPTFNDPDKQMLDDAHPSEVGSRAWADVVAGALK